LDSGTVLSLYRCTRKQATVALIAFPSLPHTCHFGIAE
jgi:hypothetical protein